jgi:hypothetical protein
MTQTLQYTPGPWLNITESLHAGFLICNADNPCWHPAKPGDKSLMLAAPRLLEALTELLEHVEWRRRIAGEKTRPNDCTR